MPNTANISVINLPVIAAAQMELDITAGTYEENISQNPNYYGVNGGFAVTPDLGDVRSDLFARGLAEGFPQGSVFRIAFNEHSFDETSGEIDANLDEILRDMSAEGMKFIFTYEKGGITDTEVDPQEALEGDLKDVMVDSYQNLARYLDKEFSVGLSTVALEVGQSRAIYDFIINTTDEGARDEKIAELSEIYAEQASAIQSVVNPYFYNSYIATGFGPDRSIEGFSDAALAQLRSAFKSDLIWGTTVPTDPDVDLDAFHAAYGDDVYFAIDNNRDGQSDTGYAWYAENNVGIAWNPSNPAANIVAADENGNVLVLDQAAYAARLEVMMGQTNAELMPDDDIVDLRSIDAEMHNAPDSPDAIVDRATVDDAGGMAIGAGYGGNDIIDGRAGFNNMLYGGEGNDTLRGSGRDDFLYGGLGNDVIFAAGGNDHVFGGAGNDLISAMRGYNTLTGGEGRNHFSVHTEGKTVITDFSYLNGDTLDFRGVYTGTSEIISRVSILDYQGSGTDRDLMIWHANGGYTILLGAANLVSVLDEVLPSLTHDAAELVLQVDAETGVPFDPQTSEGHMIPHARPDAGAAATIFAEASGDDISTDQDNPHLVGGAGNDTLTVTPAGTSVDHDIWAGGGRNTVDIQSGVTGVVSIHDYTSADTIRVDGSDLDLAVLPGGTVVEDRPTGITVIYQNGLTLHIFDEAIADAYESDPDRNTIGDDFEAAFDPDAPAPEGRVEPDYPTTPDPVEPVDPDPVDPVDPDPVDPVDPDPVDPVEPDPVDPDAPLTNPSLGIGLNGVTDWSTQSPFIDVFKTSRPWVGHTTEGWGSLAQEEMDAILDENGYMTEMPDGASGVSAIFLTEMPAEMTSIAGRYRMTFDGEAEFRLLGASNVTFGEGEVWFDYTPSGNNMISLDITSIGTDYMRNISVVHESNIEAFEAGEIFNPDWIDLISDMRVLRYMDWQRTNNSDLSTWEDRAEADDATWATDAGVPLEVMIELANQTGTDPWFNIPHMADEAFIREFVTYVRNNLDPELQPHFEYSNEVWNWQFEQAQWAHDMGQQEWPDTGSAWVQYYAQKASEMAQIIDDVYGPDVNDMVKKIISTQTGWEGLEGDILTAPQWVEASGEDEPYTNFNAYGVTGYFSGGLGGDKAALVKDWIAQSRERAAFEGGQIGLTGAELEEYIEEHKFDTAIAVAAAELRDGSVTGDPQDTLEDLFASFEYHKSVADAHGLDLIMYEGGTHIVGINGNQDDEELTEFFTALNASDQMGQLYIELLAGWMDAGGTLFNAFVDVGRHSKHGSWGALEHLDDSSARWDALVEFNRENPGWWEERGQDDFLGSTEGDEVEPIDPVDPDPVDPDPVDPDPVDPDPVDPVDPDPVDPDPVDPDPVDPVDPDPVDPDPVDPDPVDPVDPDPVDPDPVDPDPVDPDPVDPVDPDPVDPDPVDPVDPDPVDPVDPDPVEPEPDLSLDTSGDIISMGTRGDDVVLGGQGDDILHSGDGSDMIYAGAGDDYILGGAGFKVIFAADGDDIIFTGKGGSVISAGAGNDRITADITESGQVMTGGAGNDSFLFMAFSGKATQSLITDFDIHEDELLINLGKVDLLNLRAGQTGTQTDDGFLIEMDNGSSILLQGVNITDDVF